MDSSQGYLVINPGSADAYRVELEDGKVLEIGRKAGAASQKRLVLPVPEVSGNHAEIRNSADGWCVRDLGSTNGTRLNGDWLAPGQEYLLKNGDVIKIAAIDLQVNLPNDNGASGRRAHAEEDEHEKTQFHIKLINATILVGDIRSFTSLMENYSEQPERVMHSAQRVFQHLSEEVKRHHGQVEKVAGDAIMAYWQGADSPQNETNICAYQACYAALQVKSAVHAMAANPDSWPFEGFPLQVDIALATGPVAAGVLGSAKSNPALLGDTANLAFRLEKLIGEDAPGDIIMDGSTYELVKNQVSVYPLGPYTVKGRQRPVDVYRLLSMNDSG